MHGYIIYGNGTVVNGRKKVRRIGQGQILSRKLKNSPPLRKNMISNKKRVYDDLSLRIYLNDVGEFLS